VFTWFACHLTSLVQAVRPRKKGANLPLRNSWGTARSVPDLYARLSTRRNAFYRATATLGAFSLPHATGGVRSFVDIERGEGAKRAGLGGGGKGGYRFVWQ
jgi:hypothetical protein